MTIYLNNNQNSDIASVETAPVNKGNLTFFHLRGSESFKGPTDRKEAKEWLATEMGQRVEAEARSNGTVLVTRGDKSAEELFAALKKHGESLEPVEEKKKVDPWKLRGWASMIGQPLQLASGLLQKGPPDAATIGFATSNIIANITNIVFGAQKEQDVHHLRHAKDAINNQLQAHIPEGKELPSIDDERLKLRGESDKDKGNPAYEFMRRNSVTVGEIGLRYLGSLMMAFPLTQALKKDGKEIQSYAHWKTGIGELGKGEFKKAFETLKVKDKANLYAGLAYIAGKTLAFSSKVPDPYNPDKKHTALDTFREKIVFRLSSTIEACAAMIISLDRLNIVSINKNADGSPKLRKLSVDNLVKLVEKKGREAPGWLKKLSTDKAISGREAPKWLKTATERDWLGGIGGLLFTGGLLIRIFAPFGTREVDMDEFRAHVTDTLALVPPDKLPQALAEATASTQAHFKDKKLEFGTLYHQFADDLEKYHHITVGAPSQDQTQDGAAGQTATLEKTFAKPELRKPDMTSLPQLGSFQDRTAATQSEALQRA